jgi:hypothetical protein
VHTLGARAEDGTAGERAVTVAAGDDREVTIDLAPHEASTAPDPAPSLATTRDAPLPPAPPPYVAERPPSASPAFAPRWYVRGGLALADETRKFAGGFDQTSPTSRDLAGPALVARFGREMGSWWSLELLADVGMMGPSSYGSPYRPSIQADVRYTRESLVAMLRMHTLGRFRFTGATGLGPSFEQVRAVLGESDGGLKTSTGYGLGVTWVAEVGAELDLGKAVLEAAAFTDVHGLGGAEDATGQSFFGDGPGVRSGLRLLVGWRL